MKLLPLAAGLVPFVLGWLTNGYILANPEKVPPLLPIAVATLVLWGALAFWFRGKLAKTGPIVLLMNLIPAVILVLLGVQELVFGAYWGGLPGIWTQLYYLPLLNLGASLAPWASFPIVLYTICFLLLAAASLAGCKLRERR